jgi:hypothetical protein
VGLKKKEVLKVLSWGCVKLIRLDGEHSEAHPCSEKALSVIPYYVVMVLYVICNTIRNNAIRCDVIQYCIRITLNNIMQLTTSYDTL